MAIKKYRSEFSNWAQDDLASGWIGDCFGWLSPFRTTYTYRGQWVDSDKYDIVPKDSYKKILIEEKENEIAELKKQQELLEGELKKLKA